jgi:hypothetical protein
VLQRLEALSSRFAGEGLAIYARKTGQAHVDAKDGWLTICRQLHAAAGLPAMEAELSEPWSREAKAVLPSSSPQLHANAIWGPVVAFCVLHGMAQTIGDKETGVTALALFDRLRLREPLARAFSLAGEISEDGWRAAARVRLAFLGLTLTPAKPVKAAVQDESAGFPRAFWEDGDARWLLKVHEAAGEWYFNKELHQQLLWWAQLPDLLQLASQASAPLPAASANAGSLSTAPAVTAEKTARRPAARLTPSIKAIEQRVQEASEQAEEDGYRIGKKKDTAAKPAKREKGALAK